MKISGLDLRLGVRLLLKYPGLTIVGGLAMTFAIAVGAGAFEVVKQLVDPTLPLDEGDRIVAIRTRDLSAGEYGNQTMRDLVSWRESMTTVEQLSAFRTLERNLSIDGGVPEPVQLAEMSASGFRVARVAPILGRTLVDADERVGATPVAVIGYEVWQQRFAGNPNIIGRDIRVGSVAAAVVGVMPAGFAFPIAHRLWVPLRADEASSSDEAPVQIFGRLVSRVTLEKAESELATIGVRTAPTELARRQLRPVVTPYPLAYGSISLDGSPAVRALFYAINLFFVMLLVLVCANVALLMFARAAAREAEIVVRIALGASRGRIVKQLFSEALVLGCLAAIIGLVVSHFALAAFHRVYEIESNGRLPFWFAARLSLPTVLYTAVLALIASAIAGVLPALKMTGRRLHSRLRQVAAGGGGLRFGRVWTIVIVAQVTATVAFPAASFFVRQSVVQGQTMDVGFPAERYLSARLELDPLNDSANFYNTTRELTRRLAQEPGVISVALTDRLPRTQHPTRAIEVEDVASATGASFYRRIANASVDLNYFEALGARVLAGRPFNSSDRNSHTVIVNESFVRRVFGGRNALGQRFRYIDGVGDQRPWYEIVGVVKDLGMIVDRPDSPGVYHALPDNAFPVQLLVQLRGDPAAFGPRMRALAATIDAGLRLDYVVPLTEAGASMWLEFNFLFKLLAGVSAIALVLSLAGIYAVTSFAVARRTREIGIRVALGADTGRVVAAVLSRPVGHLGIGILAGGCITGALAYGVMRDALEMWDVAAIVAYAAVMMGVCLLACVVPMRRALRIQPTEALRHD